MPKEEYPERFIHSAFERYQSLKDNPEYRKQWDVLESLYKKARRMAGSSWLMAHYILAQNFCQKWEISYQISPYLNLSERDLEKAIRPGSNISKFLYAFGLDGSASVERKKKVPKPVSERQSKRELEVEKFSCYFLTRTLKLTDRAIARMLSIDKKTVKSWADQVESWDPSKKKFVFNEMENGRRFRNKDAYGNEEDKEYESMWKGKPVIKVQHNKNIISIKDSDLIQTKEGLFKLKSTNSEQF